MFQQGIDLQSLDPSYVSSISWYFLNVFGLRGLLYIILGEGNGNNINLIFLKKKQKLKHRKNTHIILNLLNVYFLFSC